MNKDSTKKGFIFETDNITSDENYQNNIKFLETVVDSIEALEDIDDLPIEDNFWSKITVTDENNEQEKNISKEIENFQSIILYDFIDVNEEVVSMPRDPTKPTNFKKVYFSQANWQEWKKNHAVRGGIEGQVHHPLHGVTYIVLEIQVQTNAKDLYRTKIHSLVTEIKKKCLELENSPKAKKFIEDACLEEFKKRLEKSLKTLPLIRQYFEQFFKNHKQNLIAILYENFSNGDYITFDVFKEISTKIDIIDDEEKHENLYYFNIIFDVIKGIYNRQNVSFLIQKLKNKVFINKVTVEEFKQLCARTFQKFPTPFQDSINDVLNYVIDDDEHKYEMTDIKADLLEEYGYENSYIVSEIEKKLRLKKINKK